MSIALRVAALVVAFGFWLAPTRASAQVVNQEFLCDSSITDCRQTVLQLMDAETVGIDIGFWYMEESQFADRLVRAWNRGVAVRVIADTKANEPYPGNITNLARLANAGIPIRRTNSRYMHWKTAIFAGQNVVQTGSANYSPWAFVPPQPLVNFIDETILFSNDPNVVNSFKRRFDDMWVSSYLRNHANSASTPVRSYPVFAVDPELNFPPFNTDLGGRSPALYNAEDVGIDTIMYRITDSRHTNAIIAAIERGVPVRLITEPNQYREPTRYLHSLNVDRIYMAMAARGEPWRLRHRRHDGANHQKTTLLHEQRMSIFGSQNWTTTSGQYEHNYFTRKAWIYDWFVNQFERKWNSTTETEPFVPLPPDAPVYQSPATGASIQDTSVTLRWHGGLWAHVYDVYLGTSQSAVQNLDPSTRVATDLLLGPSTTPTSYLSYTATGLTQDTTYYWKVVSKTMANMTRGGTVWNFRIGTAPAAGEGDVVLWAARAPVVQGNWAVVADSSAAGGSRIHTPNGGVKVSSPLASPASYFEMSFTAAAGVPYRLWLRGKAASNSWASDSAFVQFSGSVTSTGTPTWRIGSTSATTVSIEDCTGCGLSSWGWQDNAYNDNPGALGTPVYFEASGPQTIRVQMREDGLSLDQIVLSSEAFLTSAPGTTKNDGTILPESDSSGEPPPPPPPALPSPWESQDIGAVGVAGSASATNGVFTVSGAGTDIWGTSDAFHYAFRAWSGDGTLIARVVSLSGSQSWTKMGVMIRSSTAPDSAHALMLVSRSKGMAFQYRTANGGSTSSTAGSASTAPRWVKLERVGSVISAFESGDGTAWTLVGSATFTMPAGVLVGLVAHSHTTTALATATFDNVSVTTPSGEPPPPPPPPLPAGWESRDVGAVGVAGSAIESSGTFTVRGAGADIWGTADAFHYAYRSLSGDGTIVARVASIDGSQAWTKMGVMIRNSTAANAAHALMLVSTGKGLAFQRRTTDGATSASTSGGAGTAPRWVKLERSGNLITASTSTDGVAWTVVGSDSFVMGADVLIGLVAHGHTTSSLATATFDNVAITTP